MLVVNFFTLKSQLDQQMIAALLPYLPQSLSVPWLKKKHWKDSHLSLISKLLLLVGLKDHFNYELRGSEIKYDQFHRPSIGLDFDFNISHSEDFVVCAIGRNMKVGIDTEKIADINLNDFVQQFNEVEWEMIRTANYPYKVFYKLWTRKEAVVKGDGRGLNIPLKKLDVCQKDVWVDDKLWYLKELNINKKYYTHVATNCMIERELITLTEYNLKQLVCKLNEEV